MVAYSTSPAEFRAKDISLNQGADRFLATYARAISATQSAVATFSLKLTPSQRSIQPSGDRIAVMVAERLLGAHSGAPLAESCPRPTRAS